MIYRDMLMNELKVYRRTEFGGVKVSFGSDEDLLMRTIHKKHVP